VNWPIIKHKVRTLFVLSSIGFDILIFKQDMT